MSAAELQFREWAFALAKGNPQQAQAIFDFMMEGDLASVRARKLIVTVCPFPLEGFWWQQALSFLEGRDA